MTALVPISGMPLGPRHWYIFAVASAEQLVGAALSTIVGIMIPLIILLGTPHIDSMEQGILGASGLVGIALGSIVIGNFMDETGYLLWFRICPLVIAAGSAGVWFSCGTWQLALFLFIIGLGVGGGYSLDSGYISELMPARWESFFVGLAKATCSLGFIGGAAAGFFMLRAEPHASAWPDLILPVGALGLLTFLFRLRWYQSPGWLMEKGRPDLAQKAARGFFGPEAEMTPPAGSLCHRKIPWSTFFKGQNLKKVALTGISWACEGLGVYGFGVFLPILVMALGMQSGTDEGISRILDSIRVTIFINIFIAAGFGIGLAIIHRVNLLMLMGCGFLLCAFALMVLLAAHALDWPVWISFLSFVIFETALNAGPHLVTFIVPSKIYPVEERGTGMGIATMFGKLGAILGVFFMPALLAWGGIAAVLWVSILVQLLGAAVTFICGKELELL